MSLSVIALAVCLATGADQYSQDVKPVLIRRCASCHGALKAKAGLRLDTAAAMLRGGDSGAAVEPGNAGESLILERVTAADKHRMPPEGDPLSTVEIESLRRWINSGAEAPRNEPVPADPRKHWSFQPPIRSDRLASGSNPIDTYFQDIHVEKKLKSRPQAGREVLLRRVTLDLTGLVPSVEEMKAFLEDTSPEAYEKAVDRLLASPRYGERWARHWMDVWRYSDWDGFGAEIRESRPFIWHWRDWIVESLNSDVSYDRMIVLMLAADEAEPENDSAQRAGGFLARNWYRFNRNTWLENTVEHTSKAFLGLTMNCARCHDHKYDPISQKDYYRFRAFFEPHDIREDHLPLGVEAEKEGVPRVYDSKPAEPTFLFAKGDERAPDKTTPLSPGLPSFLSSSTLTIEPVRLPRLAQSPYLRDGAKAVLREAASRVVTEARNTLKAAKPEDRAAAEAALAVAEARKHALEARLQADAAKLTIPQGPEAMPLAMSARRAEVVVALREAEQRLLASQAKLSKARRDSAPGISAIEAEFAANAAAVSTQFGNVTTLATDYTPAGTVYPAESTGRRLSLARWIASKQNPLTARVAVNHIWMRHFGRPLVASPADFGRNGSAPSHTELLDTLAVKFMDSGWSQKAMHRTIVTSAAYRRESSAGDDTQNSSIDPENLDYWRMNTRRLEAESVRDSLLFVAGSLDFKLGGPDIDPEAAMTSTRRSLYLRHSQEKRATFLKVFDSPNVVECYRRAETVMPHQALALANSPLSLESARKLTALLKNIGSEQEFIKAVFERVLNRLPSLEERSACEQFLQDFHAKNSIDPECAARARVGLVHVLFNHTDFVTIR